MARSTVRLDMVDFSDFGPGVVRFRCTRLARVSYDGKQTNESAWFEWRSSSASTLCAVGDSPSKASFDRRRANASSTEISATSGATADAAGFLSVVGQDNSVR
jgi:hypothetical protein